MSFSSDDEVRDSERRFLEMLQNHVNTAKLHQVQSKESVTRVSEALKERKRTLSSERRTPRERSNRPTSAVATQVSPQSLAAQSQATQTSPKIRRQEPRTETNTAPSIEFETFTVTDHYVQEIIINGVDSTRRRDSTQTNQSTITNQSQASQDTLNSRSSTRRQDQLNQSIMTNDSQSTQDTVRTRSNIKRQEPPAHLNQSNTTNSSQDTIKSPGSKKDEQSSQSNQSRLSYDAQSPHAGSQYRSAELEQLNQSRIISSTQIAPAPATAPTQATQAPIKQKKVKKRRSLLNLLCGSRHNSDDEEQAVPQKVTPKAHSAASYASTDGSRPIINDAAQYTNPKSPETDAGYVSGHRPMSGNNAMYTAGEPRQYVQTSEITFSTLPDFHCPTPTHNRSPADNWSPILPPLSHSTSTSTATSSPATQQLPPQPESAQRRTRILTQLKVSPNDIIRRQTPTRDTEETSTRSHQTPSSVGYKPYRIPKLPDGATDLKDVKSPSVAASDFSTINSDRRTSVVRPVEPETLKKSDSRLKKKSSSNKNRAIQISVYSTSVNTSERANIIASIDALPTELREAFIRGIGMNTDSIDLVRGLNERQKNQVSLKGIYTSVPRETHEYRNKNMGIIYVSSTPPVNNLKKKPEPVHPFSRSREPTESEACVIRFSDIDRKEFIFSDVYSAREEVQNRKYNRRLVFERSESKTTKIEYKSIELMTFLEVMQENQSLQIDYEYIERETKELKQKLEYSWDLKLCESGMYRQRYENIFKYFHILQKRFMDAMVSAESDATMSKLAVPRLKYCAYVNNFPICVTFNAANTRVGVAVYNEPGVFNNVETIYYNRMVLYQQVNLTRESATLMEKDLELLKNVRHPNILNLLMYNHQPNKNVCTLAFECPLMGSLAHFLMFTRYAMCKDDEFAAFYLGQLLMVYYYFDCIGIVLPELSSFDVMVDMNGYLKVAGAWRRRDYNIDQRVKRYDTIDRLRSFGLMLIGDSAEESNLVTNRNYRRFYKFYNFLDMRQESKTVLKEAFDADLFRKYLDFIELFHQDYNLVRKFEIDCKQIFELNHMYYDQ